MYREKRISELKRLLAERQGLSIEEVMAVGDVSRDTARRDILALVSDGYGKRTRGGIVSPTFGHTIPSYSERLKHFSSEKSALAARAHEWIQPGGVYFIDDATTLLQLSQSIEENVTIYTHSLDNAIALSVKPDVELRLLGGKLNHHGRFFFDAKTCSELADIAFDVAFIGAAAISAQGVYFPYANDAKVKQTLVETAREVVVVSETMKFETTAPYRGFALDQIDAFVTNTPLSSKQMAYFKGKTDIVVVN